MPNLVYYKDGNGVVSGPLRESEATALYKANFFNPDHVFRVVDADDVDTFKSIDDLRTQNGIDSPFGKPIDNEEKELVRVYKELSIVLKDRNELRAKNSALGAELAQQGEALTREKKITHVSKKGSFSFARGMCLMDDQDAFPDDEESDEEMEDEEMMTELRSHVDITVQAWYGNAWDPERSCVVRPHDNTLFGPEGGTYLFIAPYLPEDPSDPFISKHVHKFLCKTSKNERLAKCTFP